MATLDEFERQLREAVATGRLRKELEVGLRRLALLAERQAKLNATTRPRVRTGRLRSSITGRVVVTDLGPALSLSAGAPWSRVGIVAYARIQELGGLTGVPTGSRTAAGVLRRAATSLRVPRRIPATHYLGRALDDIQPQIPAEVGEAVYRTLRLP